MESTEQQDKGLTLFRDDEIIEIIRNIICFYNTFISGLKNTGKSFTIKSIFNITKKREEFEQSKFIYVECKSSITITDIFFSIYHDLKEITPLLKSKLNYRDRIERLIDLYYEHEFIRIHLNQYYLGSYSPEFDHLEIVDIVEELSKNHLKKLCNLILYDHLKDGIIEFIHKNEIKEIFLCLDNTEFLEELVSTNPSFLRIFTEDFNCCLILISCNPFLLEEMDFGTKCKLIFDYIHFSPYSPNQIKSIHAHNRSRLVQEKSDKTKLIT